MIDVIIPTYNRALALRDSLPTYIKQKMLGSIIIVDDASTDNTYEVVQDFKKIYPNIIYIKIDKKITLPAVRNIGIKAATAEYIFMGEDDVYLDENHFQNLFEQLNTLNADLVAGRRLYISANQSQNEAIITANLDRDPIFVNIPFEGYFERYIDKIQKVPFLHSNSFGKSSVFKKYLYNEFYLGNAFREELDFYLRILNDNGSMYLLPDVYCFHLKGAKTNSSGGARMKRLIYEYYVWRNTFICFWKNRKILRIYWHIYTPVFYAFVCLVARYFYGFKRRIVWLINKKNG